MLTSFKDPSTSLFSDVKCANSEFGQLPDPSVVGDGSNNDHGETLTTGLLHGAHNPRNGNWRSVNFAHKQTPQHDFVELGVCTTSQVSVQLKESMFVLILLQGFVF